MSRHPARVGGLEPVSLNGEGGSKIGQKKCHVLFEWPLTGKHSTRSTSGRRLLLVRTSLSGGSHRLDHCGKTTDLVCHGFRLTKGDDYFWVDFDNFYIEQ
jgi:hypothetical protein